MCMLYRSYFLSEYVQTSSGNQYLSLNSMHEHAFHFQTRVMQNANKTLSAVLLYRAMWVINAHKHKPTALITHNAIYFSCICRCLSCTLLMQINSRCLAGAPDPPRPPPRSSDPRAPSLTDQHDTNVNTRASVKHYSQLLLPAWASAVPQCTAAADQKPPLLERAHSGLPRATYTQPCARTHSGKVRSPSTFPTK